MKTIKERMIYTDGTFLLADTIAELHLIAQNIGLSGQCFYISPLPHYILDSTSRERLEELTIQWFSNAAQLLHRYYQRNQSADL